jgi:hypothetical protein
VNARMLEGHEMLQSVHRKKKKEKGMERKRNKHGFTKKNKGN